MPELPEVETTVRGLARYLDGARQHRLSLLLENLLDRDYTTSMDSGARKVQNLGRPFTSEVRYTYSF